MIRLGWSELNIVDQNWIFNSWNDWLKQIRIEYLVIGGNEFNLNPCEQHQNSYETLNNWWIWFLSLAVPQYTFCASRINPATDSQWNWIFGYEFNHSCCYVSLLCTSRSQPRVSFSAGMSQNARFSSILKSSDLRHLCPVHGSPKHFNNTPKMVSIFPSMCTNSAAFRMHCQIN